MNNTEPCFRRRTLKTVEELKEAVLSFYDMWRNKFGVLLFLYSVILTKVCATGPSDARSGERVGGRSADSSSCSGLVFSSSVTPVKHRSSASLSFSLSHAEIPCE